jgi:D-sedoheptulose 7-phosphate isomerase
MEVPGMTYAQEELVESSMTISKVDGAMVERIATAVAARIKEGGKLVTFGNGGSAADAMHIAAELAGRYRMDRPGMQSISLSSLSTITAIGNDFSYDEVFERQVEGLVRKGDAVLGISTSGNSRNVLRGIRKAKELGALTISFSGEGGQLRHETDLALVIPSRSTPRIQEAYLCSGHIMCGLIERHIYGRKAVLIDRDDTIAKDVPYCSRPEDLHLFDGVPQAIADLNRAGYLVIVVTNQSGVARGLFDEEMLRRIHEKMKRDVEAGGGRIDAIYHCPHLPDAGCGCRKPATGMAIRAINEWGIDTGSSWVVGDRDHDVEMGRKIGCRTIQVSKDLPFHEAARHILDA